MSQDKLQVDQIIIEGAVTLKKKEGEDVLSVSHPIDMGANVIKSTGAPSDDSDLMTKSATASAISTGTEGLLDAQGVMTIVNGLTAQFQKANVRVATTGNITLNGSATPELDDVTLAEGDRISAKDQDNPEENGIYIFSSGAWSRSSDMDTVEKCADGSWFLVSEGTENAETGWKVVLAPQILEVDPLLFVIFMGTGSSSSGDIFYNSGTKAMTQGTEIILTHGNTAAAPMNRLISAEMFIDGIGGEFTSNLIHSIPSDSEEHENLAFGASKIVTGFVVDTVATTSSDHARGHFVDSEDAAITLGVGNDAPKVAVGIKVVLDAGSFYIRSITGDGGGTNGVKLSKGILSSETKAVTFIQGTETKNGKLYLSNDPGVARRVILDFESGSPWSNSVPDYSGITWTGSGGAVSDTNQFRSGTRSAYLDGTNDCKIAPSSYTGLLLTGLEDFAISVDIRKASWTGAKETIVCSGNSSLNSMNSFSIGSAGIYWYCRVTGGDYQIVTGSFAFQTNTWYNVAISKTGNTIRLYVDGNLVGSGSDSAWPAYTSPVYTWIGLRDLSSIDDMAYIGWIDSFQMCIGNNGGFAGSTINDDINAWFNTFPTNNYFTSINEEPINIETWDSISQVSVDDQIPAPAATASILYAFCIEDYTTDRSIFKVIRDSVWRDIVKDVSGSYYYNDHPIHGKENWSASSPDNIFDALSRAAGTKYNIESFSNGGSFITFDVSAGDISLKFSVGDRFIVTGAANGSNNVVWEVAVGGAVYSSGQTKVYTTNAPISESNSQAVIQPNMNDEPLVDAIGPNFPSVTDLTKLWIAKMVSIGNTSALYSSATEANCNLTVSNLQFSYGGAGVWEVCPIGIQTIKPFTFNVESIGADSVVVLDNAADYSFYFHAGDVIEIVGASNVQNNGRCVIASVAYSSSRTRITIQSKSGSAFVTETSSPAVVYLTTGDISIFRNSPTTLKIRKESAGQRNMRFSICIKSQ